MIAHAPSGLGRLVKLRPAKPAMLLVGCMALVMALLVAAVTAAVGLGGLAGLGGLLGGGSLDYARGPTGEFFPLTDSFVDDALGGDSGASPSAPTPAVPIAPGAGSPSAITTPGRIDNSREVAVPPPDEAGADLRVDANLVELLDRQGRVPLHENGELDHGAIQWPQFTSRL